MLYKFLKLVLCISPLACTQLLLANSIIHHKFADTTKKSAKKGGADDDAGEVSTILTTPNKNALYNEKGKYTFEVKNTTNTEQVGKVSYQVTTETGVKLNADSVKVKIAKKSTERYSFDIPEPKPGFYKVNFMINVTDYDDTTRRVFGIRPDEIISPYKKPADFDAFWQKAKDELAKVKPNFKVTPLPKQSTDYRKAFAIEMQSADNVTIRGFMTLPVSKDKNRKFSVLVGLPGYQVDVYPIVGREEDMALITLNVRGQGNSRGLVNTRKDEFIFYHVENRDKYVMRGVIMDCIRCIDFVFSRPELRHENILVTGGSMGGYLALATASLDKRVALCSAQNAILCDVRNLVGEVAWPMSDIIKHIKTMPGLTLDKVLDNMDYYDGKNFAKNITCPTLMGIGLLDPYAPPNNEYGTYNNITANKRILVFKDLGHEVSQVYTNLEGKWMRDAFALF